MKNSSKKDNNALLLGIGFDAKDEHVRITKGENFRLYGGSEETHEKMTETAIKFNEKLSARGKKLSELSKDEFFDIISESIVK
ncbi:MAG TPA: hypothetical protein P5105_03910 [Victivallales bacterium]|nr:hypothetical protein [Victivallales bacterium]HPO91058.1 hypothetical protein [Victivallales bacterium]HRR06407.1 hypothetical protein [Victivallales bacterium]HRR27844.1 hypothetical protein [Victivallales bacterium]HRU01048.1 hypothetical protein [Victivallales bacterium]